MGIAVPKDIKQIKTKGIDFDPSRFYTNAIKAGATPADAAAATRAQFAQRVADANTTPPTNVVAATGGTAVPVYDSTLPPAGYTAGASTGTTSGTSGGTLQTGFVADGTGGGGGGVTLQATTPPPAPAATPFYKKPVTYLVGVGGLAAAAAGFFFLKKRR